MSAYYNELDPSAAAWLRELIKRNLIAPGDVDERSIADVSADDVRGYAQAHFFAGIGVWSYALRQAGWPDSRPVWTGSCPCQPFSAAGKGEGYADERHLWPHWNRLISECAPTAIFGEQVDAAIRTGWLDDVCLSLESLGYAVGAVSFPACSVGAPHIRQRLYFVADSCGTRMREDAGAIRREGPNIAGDGERLRDGANASGAISGLAQSEKRRSKTGERISRSAEGARGWRTDAERCSFYDRRTGIIGTGLMDNAFRNGRGKRRDDHRSDERIEPSADGIMGDTIEQGPQGHVGHVGNRDEPGRLGEIEAGSASETGGTEFMGNAAAGGFGISGSASRESGFAAQPSLVEHADRTRASNGELQRSGELGRIAEDARPGATNGFWRNAEWIACRDGKSRPVEPGSPALVTGAAARVVRLRGYGNSINAEAAKAFIEAYMSMAR